MPEQNNVQIVFGGEVKALTDGANDGRIGGYLVLFSTAADPDITKKKDFFTKNTDFDLEASTKSTVLYDHALDPTIKRRKLGIGEMKVDDVGVWIEAQLNLRDEYEQAIYAMAKAGKLGWSSGAPSHLVERKAWGNGAHEILSWPLGKDASLTPTPAEPRIVATTDLGSYQQQEFKALRFVRADEGDKPTNPPAVEAKTARDQFITVEIKAAAPADTNSPMSGSALYERELSKRSQQVWELWSSLNAVFEKIGKMARKGDDFGITPDVPALVGDAITAFVARLTPAVIQQISDDAGGEGSDDHFWIKSALDRLENISVSEIKVRDHSAVVVSAVEEIATKGAALVEPLDSFTQRIEDKQKFREETKAGRKLSAATMENIGQSHANLGNTITALQAIHKRIGDLMESVKPKEEAPPVVMAKSADEETIRQLLAESLLIESRFAQAGLAARAAA